MIQDKKTIAFEANPTTASVAFGLALGFMPRMFQELERPGLAMQEEKKEEIKSILLIAFRTSNVVAGTREAMLKDKKFMAEMEKMFGKIDFEEAV